MLEHQSSILLLLIPLGKLVLNLFDGYDAASDRDDLTLQLTHPEQRQYRK